ncbi:hypothetical protein CYMTET_17902 [Cymbomonas tetramitiformis]|uniref:Uncharacterized protein n=1 Tax=Cymbomonas tetramitiformis TaxID=36881 RepID=A0AAE0G9M3_9CHLO|nr:hypothetical protein CYMTET_17902 [Cymbomonas tetramitiformis]
MYGKPFRAIHSTGTFKHNCYVTGCVALGGVCEEHGKTLVVGQKSVDLMEYLVERLAQRPLLLQYGVEQKTTNFFTAVFNLAHELSTVQDGNVEEDPEQAYVAP